VSQQRLKTQSGLCNPQIIIAERIAVVDHDRLKGNFVLLRQKKTIGSILSITNHPSNELNQILLSLVLAPRRKSGCSRRPNNISGIPLTPRKRFF
jgi:hypothetical protein